MVKLLLQMGYGSGINEAGMVTQQSNDGGIYGIIKEDQRGFNNIYIQAKQWTIDSWKTGDSKIRRSFNWRTSPKRVVYNYGIILFRRFTLCRKFVGD